jgi:hypothetical protein
MKNNEYKSFIKYKNDIVDVLYCDIILKYIYNSSNKYIYTINLNGKFVKNNKENSFTSIIYISITIHNNIAKLDSVNIKNILIDINNFSLSTNKYFNTNNMFDLFSSEFENDSESDLYLLIETMFLKSSVTVFDEMFIFNFKFNNNDKDFIISSLDIILKEKCSTLFKNKISNLSLVNSSNNIDYFSTIYVIIAICSIFLIFKNNNFNPFLLKFKK